MDDNGHTSRNEPGMLRISRIEVQNFKSLVDFKIELAKFSCLIGMNGAGKSTVLQFVDFMSQLVRGDMKSWLSERNWKASELLSVLGESSNIEFSVRLVNGQNEDVGGWNATYDPHSNICVEETISISNDVMSIENNEVCIDSSEHPETKAIEITFDYEGSILSVLKEEVLPESIKEFKRLLEQTSTFDLLSPSSLKSPTQKGFAALGRSGEDLPAYLSSLGNEKRTKIKRRLQEAYPRIQAIGISTSEDGWKHLEIDEGFKNAQGHYAGISTDAIHLNDGMLRLVAIVGELESEFEFLLFDEIENGINPELVEYVLVALVNSPKQILVTTHSPMILNYLDDEIAKQGVIYLYKTSRGHTKAIPFFSIPSLAVKLKVMGPGEAFVDTNLRQLAEEIAEVTGEEA